MDKSKTVIRSLVEEIFQNTIANMPLVVALLQDGIITKEELTQPWVDCVTSLEANNGN